MGLKVEGTDFVVCRECGHQAAKLYRHITKHGLTSREYQAKYGEDAPLRCDANAARQRTAREARLSASPRSWQATKQVACPTCAELHTVGKQMGSLHDLRCPACKAAGTLEASESLWQGKSEPEDYVTCLDCGHRAESLTSHLQNTHSGYRDRHPGALVVALGSAVRDKTALRGQVLPDETRAKMSLNAGRWNAGLTKETDERVARGAEKMRGQTPWSKGLTARSDERLRATVAKLKTYVGENRPWHNGLKADLTLEDFQPFMDEEGRIDRRSIQEALGLSWRTIYTYMGAFDLGTSAKYVQERAEAQTVRLAKEALEEFKLGNGKVSIARAMRDTGHSFKVIKRECGRHGLETFHRRIRQTLCLDAVSKALGDEPFEEEWKDRRFTNPKTGWRYRYDGYFPEVGLIVEFHGHQHFMFPNAFHPRVSAYLAGRERDQHKEQLIQDAEGLHYFMVRYDEPFTDVSYLRGRLVEAGIL